MKKIFQSFIFLFCVFVLPFSTNASITLEHSFDALGSQSWTDVKVSGDGSTYIASTFTGKLYMSSDGNNWTLKKDFNALIISSISISDDAKEIVVSQFTGQIFVSHDGGNTWTASNAPIGYWQDVVSNNTGQIVLASSGTSGEENLSGDMNKNLFISRDYGRTFTSLAGFPRQNISSIALSNDGKKIVATPYNKGYVIISKDSGVTWQEIESLGESYWHHVAMTPDGLKIIVSVIKKVDFSTIKEGGLAYLNLFVTGKPGYLYMSVDGGTNWNELTDVGERDWREVAISSDGKVIVGSSITGDLGSSGVGEVLISRDFGNTWSEFVDNNQAISDISISKNGNRMVLINQDNGFIFTSTDSGLTFNKRSVVSPQYWFDVEVSGDGSNIIASPFNSFLVRSSDGGSTWDIIQELGLRGWADIDMTPSGKFIGVAYGTDAGGGLFLSQDGGKTWSEADFFSDKHISSINISKDGKKIFVSTGLGGVSDDSVNNKGYIYVSKDYGNTWDIESQLGYKRWQSIKSSDDGKVLVATTFNTKVYTQEQNGKIFISNNSGLTWNQVNVNNGNWNLPLVSSDGKTIVMITKSGNNRMIVSKDSGLNWEEKVSISGPWVTMSLSGKIYISIGAFVYHSIDLGNTWNKFTDNIGSSAGPVGIVDNESILVAAANPGGIKIYKNNDIVTTLDETEETATITGFEVKPLSIFKDSQNIIINPNNNIIKPVIQNTINPVYGPVISLTNKASATTQINNQQFQSVYSNVSDSAKGSSQNTTITPEIMVLSPAAKAKIPTNTELKVEFKTNVTGDYKIQAISVATGQVNNLSVMTVTDTTKIHTYTKVLTLNDFGYGGYKIRVGCSSCVSKPYGVSGNFIFHGVGDTGYSLLSDLQFSLMGSDVSVVEEGGEKIIKSHFRIKAKAFGDTVEIPTLKGDFYSFNLYVDGNRTSPLQGSPMWASLAKSSNVEVSFENGEFLSKASDGRFKLNASEEEIIHVYYEINMGNLLPTGKNVQVVLSTIRNDSKHFLVEFKTQTTVSLLERIRNTAGVVFSWILGK